MQETGELESQKGNGPLPTGSRKAWISIHWEELGAMRTHDFETVGELGQFLGEQPDLGKLFGYVRRS